MNWLIWTPVHRPRHVARAVRFGGASGAGCRRALLVPSSIVVLARPSKVPFLKRLFERMSNAALERENPELASAIRKLQRFGTPTTPEGAQRALARLTPGERRAYMQAAGQQAEVPEAANRAARRKGNAAQASPAPARRGSSGRKKRKR